MVSRAIHGFALACALVGCARGGGALVGHPADRETCLVTRGCPAPVLNPPCPASLAPLPLDEVMTRASDLREGRVAVRGPLNRGDGYCTLLGCGDRCCNDCAGSLALGTEAALRDKDYARTRRTTLRLSGPELGCAGDESLVCCKRDVRGQDVVAEGTLRLHGSTYILEDATVCDPSPGP